MNEPLPPKERLKAAWAEIEATDLSMAEKLVAYEHASRAIVPNTLAAYDRMVARTRAAGTLAAAPNVGDTLPDFVCSDEKGHLVSLASLLADGPLVLSLNRGHWCPYCKLELRDLARSTEAIRALGGSIVSIVPETSSFARRMITEQQLPFPVLTDIDLSFALSLGLVTLPGPELQRIYAAAGIDLAVYQGNELWLLPSPATFIIDMDGTILGQFTDPDFRRRMPVADIFEALRRAKRP